MRYFLILFFNFAVFIFLPLVSVKAVAEVRYGIDDQWFGEERVELELGQALPATDVRTIFFRVVKLSAVAGALLAAVVPWEIPPMLIFQGPLRLPIF